MKFFHYIVIIVIICRLDTAIASQADLGVSNFSFWPQMINVGAHPDSVSFRLSNYGPASLTSPNTEVMADFYISRNSTFGDGDDIQIGENGYSFTLPSGYYIIVTLSSTGLSYLTIPSGASGNYYVFVHVRHASPSTLTDPNSGNDYTMRVGQISVISPPTPSMTWHDKVLLQTKPIIVAEKVAFVNIGGNSNDGAISFSFPAFTSGNPGVNVIFASSHAIGVNFYKAGQTIHDANGNSMTAKYLLVELEDPSWTSGVTDTLILQITLQDTNPNPFLIYYRSAMGQGGRYFGDPISSANHDQQGWPVFVETIAGVRDIAGTVPTQYAISQNFPNPFNPTTFISFFLPKESHVALDIYDELGNEITSLIKSSNFRPGEFQTSWNGMNNVGNQVSSGIYFYKLVAIPMDGGHPFVETKKMLLLR